VVGEDDVRRVTDLQVLFDDHAELAERADLVEQGGGVDDHAVPKDAELVGMENARGDELEGEVMVAELHRMPGVVASLVAGHDVIVLAEKIDDLPLPLVAPLGADDGQILAQAHDGRGR
jgi:hypothetical protein